MANFTDRELGNMEARIVLLEKELVPSETTPVKFFLRSQKHKVAGKH